MTERTLTVRLPENTFLKLQKAAEVTYRSVDDLLASTIDATLIAPPDLPEALANELAALHLLGDEALWAAVLPSLSPAEQHRLEQLNHIGGERALTAAEEAEQAALLQAYYRSMLRRAQAIAILKQRGHEISPAKLATYGNFVYPATAA
ncbi:MAG: hypothetical protein DYG89_14885 [Caldilinea sp. CFX5]|nr:hypothetical protein [Caldilinea sp. CFX5]